MTLADDWDLKLQIKINKKTKQLEHNRKIYHKCEGGIEKSARHHDPCRVMPNGDHKGQIFISLPHINIGFFFLLPILTHLAYRANGNKL